MSFTDCKTTARDMELFRENLEPLLGDAKSLPIAFKLGNREIRGIPADFNPVKRQKFDDANILENTFEGTDGNGLKITVTCKLYRDYPAAEWSAYIENTGAENSPQITSLYACDFTFACENPLLYHCNGDVCGAEGYDTHTDSLIGKNFSFVPRDGRSCDGAYPYYRVIGKNFGYNIAIGWCGQWQADFSGNEKSFNFKAKQKLTDFYLKKGERAMLPSVTAMIFDGGFKRGVNVWRRWYFEHVMPRTDGNKIKPALFCHDAGTGEEFTMAYEKQQLEAIEKYLERGIDFDIWWIDAGWYICYVKEVDRKVWTRTGDWSPDPEKWPDGFKKVAELLHKRGKKLLVWFEPERFSRWHITDEYPENYFYYLNRKDENGKEYLDETALYKLGDEQAREFITRKFASFIKEQNIDVYRQDFNMGPLEWWLQNDEDGRKGLAENFHVQGYLRYWDDLLLSNSNLWLDSCASGGRRNDIETMKRAVPLHYTDYGYGEHAIKQSFTYTIFQWTPYFRNHTINWDRTDGGYEQNDNSEKMPDNDNYAFHTAFAPAICCYDTQNESDEVINYCKKMIALWRKAADYAMNGDYFPLSEYSKSTDSFYCLQFHNPDTRSGVINAVRNLRSKKDKNTVYPEQFEDGKKYLFECPEKNERFETTGKAVNEKGITFEMPARSGEYWFYREI